MYCPVSFRPTAADKLLREQSKGFTAPSHSQRKLICREAVGADARDAQGHVRAAAQGPTPRVAAEDERGLAQPNLPAVIRPSRHRARAYWARRQPQRAARLKPVSLHGHHETFRSLPTS